MGEGHSAKKGAGDGRGIRAGRPSRRKGGREGGEHGSEWDWLSSASTPMNRGAGPGRAGRLARQAARTLRCSEGHLLAYGQRRETREIRETLHSCCGGRTHADSAPAGEVRPEARRAWRVGHGGASHAGS